MASFPLPRLRSGSLALLLLAAPLVAQEELDLPRAPRATEHVLHLTDGSVLRLRARAVDGGWELEQRSGWVLLPAERVDRATPTKELLKQARRLERAVERDDPARRAMYASWLVDAGLVPEALVQLDRVLVAEPDQAEARDVVRRADFRFELPPTNRLDAFLAVASKGSPTLREVAVQRLARSDDEAARSVLEERLRTDLVHQDPAVRAFATLALRRLAPGTELEPLFRRALLDVDERVRRGAGLALGAAQEDALIVPVLEALNSQHASLRVHAAEALGTMNYPAAVEPLVDHLSSLQSGGGGPIAPRSYVAFTRQTAYVQDFDVEVSQAQAIADPIINVLSEGAVLEAAVIGVQETVVTERAAVRGALARITGQQPGNTTRAWEKWWNEHGAAWKASTSSRDPQVTSSRREP